MSSHGSVVLSWVRSRDVQNSLPWGKDAPGAGGRSPGCIMQRPWGAQRGEKLHFTQGRNSSPLWVSM